MVTTAHLRAIGHPIQAAARPQPRRLMLPIFCQALDRYSFRFYQIGKCYQIKRADRGAIRSALLRRKEIFWLSLVIARTMPNSKNAGKTLPDERSQPYLEFPPHSGSRHDGAIRAHNHAIITPNTANDFLAPTKTDILKPFDGRWLSHGLCSQRPILEYCASCQSHFGSFSQTATNITTANIQPRSRPGRLNEFSGSERNSRRECRRGRSTLAGYGPDRLPGPPPKWNGWHNSCQAVR